MYYTEAEARLKFCPFDHNGGVGETLHGTVDQTLPNGYRVAHNVSLNSNSMRKRCCGGECMLWNWMKISAKDKGYCGANTLAIQCLKSE